ncbi:MAG: hypothetical protein MUC66_01205 [Methanolinea sp.]|jgi:hypothetical protein|nr:hypothetical protein [Methanolinea sp.]
MHLYSIHETEKKKFFICPVAVTFWWYSMLVTTPFVLPCRVFWFAQAEIVPCVDGCGKGADVIVSDTPCDVVQLSPVWMDGIVFEE